MQYEAIISWLLFLQGTCTFPPDDRLSADTSCLCPCSCQSQCQCLYLAFTDHTEHKYSDFSICLLAGAANVAEPVAVTKDTSSPGCRD